jgi:hypothetical protein
VKNGTAQVTNYRNVVHPILGALPLFDFILLVIANEVGYESPMLFLQCLKAYQAMDFKQLCGDRQVVPLASKNKFSSINGATS